MARETRSSVKTFFSSPLFAVAGASSDARKYGHTIFLWYLHHNLPCTPLNPKSTHIALGTSRSTSGAGKSRSSSSSSSSAIPSPTAYPTLPSPRALPYPSQTSLSIVTPPAATRSVLEEAKEVGVNAVWLQPGSFDEEVLAFARKAFGNERVVAGEGRDGDGRASGGEEGWCVLVDGEEGLKLSGKL